MARLNEILVGRFNRTYQKVFGIKGGPPVATLAPEIMPTHEVFHGVEERYLEGWNRYGFSINQTGVAGQNAPFQLRNPIGSNVIAVIEKLTIESAAAAQMIQLAQNLTGVDLTTPGVGVTLDARQVSLGTIKPSSQTSSTAIGAFFFQAQLLTSTPFDVINGTDEELTLAPGFAYLAQGNALASQVIFNVIWRERFLEEGERL